MTYNLKICIIKRIIFRRIHEQILLWSQQQVKGGAENVETIGEEGVEGWAENGINILVGWLDVER
jgi:hypothetical protein